MWKWAPNYLRWYWEAMAAPTFVWIVFAAMLAAAHVFVARYSSSMPLWDDLEWAPVVGRASDLPLSWWWSGFNEHRIPFPRVIFIALIRATQDIRSGMYFDVYLLGAVAFSMILLARKLRGRTSWSDAFFPLLWLTWGNAENLLMMHQLSLIVPSAITCALLILFIAKAKPLTWKRSLAIGLCTFTLPLCGAPGLTPTPAIILWLLYTGVRRFRSTEEGARRSGVILLSFALATLVLIALYFYDFENPAQHTYNKDPIDTLRQAWMFLSLGFGPVAHDYWPFSGWLTGAFLLTALTTLAIVFRRKPQERQRIAGFLAIGAGIFSMAVSTGIARGGGNEWAGFAMRYVTLPSPLWCCVYLCFCLYGPAALGRFVRVSLYSLLVLVLFLNVQAGVSWGERRALATENFCKDIEAGLNIKQLAIAHWEDFYNNPGDFAARLETLRLSHFGPLASVKDPLKEGEYPMLKTQPMLVTSLKAGPRKLDNESVFLVPPECELHFSTDLSKKMVEGRFGVFPPAYSFSKPGGVRFSVELHRVAREVQILFERVLDPEEHAEDRGFQRLAIKLPDGADGAIVLRTSFGNETGDERAYGFWTDIEVR